MGHSNSFMLVSATALLMLPLVGLPSVFLAAVLLLVKRPAGRVRRVFAWVCGGLAGVLLVGAVPAIVGLMGDRARQADQAERRLTLDAPREVGGLAFPAGSQVVVQGRSPERLVGGYVPQPTRIGGLLLVQAFKVGRDGAVESGQLAEPGQIGPLPCAAGGFDRDEGRFRCTLAERAEVGGVALAAGSYATVTPHADGTPAWIVGVLASPARLGGLGCAAGKVYFEINLTECVLAGDQLVHGVWLQGGAQTGLSSRGGWSISAGSLARPLDVLGVVLPAGTSVVRLADVQSETLARGVGQGTVRFRLAPGAEVSLPGGRAAGPVEIAFSDERVRVSGLEPGGAVVLGGRSVASGVYDRVQGRWEAGGTP